MLLNKVALPRRTFLRGMSAAVTRAGSPETECRESGPNLERESHRRPRLPCRGHRGPDVVVDATERLFGIT